MKKLYSRLFTLSQREWLKGLGIAIWGAIGGLIFNLIMQLWNSHDFNILLVFTTWQPIVKLAIGAFLSYVFPTLFTNSQGQFTFVNEPMSAEQYALEKQSLQREQGKS